MDPRWEALSGVVGVAILFTPLFLAMFGGIHRMRQLREAARARRIAEYRHSSESQLLRLT
jgi:hypothetical protein